MLDRTFRAFSGRWDPWLNNRTPESVRASGEPVHLGPGDDNYFGSDDRGPGDTIYGMAGDDLLHGRRGDDKLYGGSGDDNLQGDAGRDRLYGGSGEDRLYGGSGHNFYFGGGGSDLANLSYGVDEVVYKRINESLPGEGHDTVAFFDHNQDHIDLHKLDAIAGTEADEAFTWIGDQAFSGVAGELRYSPKDDLLQADVTGDGVADFEVYIFGSHGHLQVTDIIL